MTYTLVFSCEQADIAARFRNSNFVRSGFNNHASRGYNIALDDDGNRVSYTEVYSKGGKSNFPDAQEQGDVSSLRSVENAEGQACNTTRWKEWGYDPNSNMAQP